MVSDFRSMCNSPSFFVAARFSLPYFFLFHVVACGTWRTRYAMRRDGDGDGNRCGGQDGNVVAECVGEALVGKRKLYHGWFTRWGCER